MTAERIRIRGVVQGVGFRPTVARIAKRLELAGFVYNDGDGVLIGLVGAPDARDHFVQTLLAELPPLAEVRQVERTVDASLVPQVGFRIVHSAAGPARTDIPADAAVCEACAAEVRDPQGRRFRYPFTTCTHCGPRYSIAVDVPFDRDTTSMARFPLCPACRAEYEDVEDRRYHAQAMACPVCGPKVWLAPAPDRPFARPAAADDVAAAADRLREGAVVAIKGLGSWHLCCDATNPEAVERLRRRKRRLRKPFALMARDLEIIARYAVLDDAARAALTSPAAPIVLLEVRPAPPAGAPALAAQVAPGQGTLGFMLPYTPLHRLLLEDMPAPIVATSGNLTDEPPCIGEQDAQDSLTRIADWLLFHDRPIRHRVDDSVVRVVDGALRTVRRARGLAPHAEHMPPGLEGAPPLFAAGAELKSAFALGRGSQVVLSPHLGDLEHLATFEAYVQSHRLLSKLYAHRPEAIVADLHPEYRATQWARAWAEADGLRFIEVQHHHAHVAAVMAEHGYPADAPAVLGFALDGLGMGLEGQIWGGEALLCGYADFERVGGLPPVPMLGGDLASRQPWRSLYAHLRATMAWDELEARFGALPAVRGLLERRVPMLERALEGGLGGPRASSAGRLFDAVAAAVGICFDAAEYEGQPAIELEACIGAGDMQEALSSARYAIRVVRAEQGPRLALEHMWPELLEDAVAGNRPGLVAARFHVALAEALVQLAVRTRGTHPEVQTVALSGGCMHNVRLLGVTRAGLERAGFTCLTAQRLPANDGGVAFGQAVVAAARLLG